MSDIQSLINMLQSNNPNKRYDACEELRVSPSLPPEALEALLLVTNDANPDVADAAQRAIKLHSPDKDLLQFNKADGRSTKADDKPNEAQDIAIGFFGWIIFNNIYFLFILILSFIVSLPHFRDYGILVYLGLPVVIVPLIFFAKKRIWIGIGIVVAVIINVALLASQGLEPQYFLLPLPLGVLFLPQ